MNSQNNFFFSFKNTTQKQIRHRLILAPSQRSSIFIDLSLTLVLRMLWEKQIHRLQETMLENQELQCWCPIEWTLPMVYHNSARTFWNDIRARWKMIVANAESKIHTVLLRAILSFGYFSSKVRTHRTKANVWEYELQVCFNSLLERRLTFLVENSSLENAVREQFCPMRSPEEFKHAVISMTGEVHLNLVAEPPASWEK